MILLLFFAFLAGLVTILTPCIWPLLPIILSSASLSKGHQKPLGITLGIMVSFAFFTLIISYLVRLFHFDPNVLRLVAVVVIAFLGLTMLIPQLGKVMELVLSRMSGIFGQRKHGNGFGGGFITGLSLGIVWSPCAGPILAAIAALAATGKVTGDVILVTIAYVIGVGIPLFLFAYGGQQVVTRTRFLSQYTGRVQQIFGIIMLLTALAIYTNYDQYLQTQLLTAFPEFNATLNGFESSSGVTQALNALKGSSGQQLTQDSSLLNVTSPTPAPDFVGITTWLNTDKPVTLASLKGKVVLVDFWTYTCINCIRTLPHVTSWYDKYNKDGFVVVGIHTPEFQFEHDTNNVKNAIQMYNIHYPVGQDNNYDTWNNYNNQYWPAEYLIDAQGMIRRVEFGEGNYDKMEMAIQLLLKDAGKKVNAKIDTMQDQTPTTQISPETYLGSNRMQYYYPLGSLQNGQQTLTLSDGLPQNSFSYGGSWTIADEFATAGSNATLNYNFVASNVYIILDPPAGQKGQVRVLVDGKPIDTAIAGEDVHDGIVTVATDRLYHIVNLHGKTENHTLKLEFLTPGVQAFTFTFG